MCIYNIISINQMKQRCTLKNKKDRSIITMIGTEEGDAYENRMEIYQKL